MCSQKAKTLNVPVIMDPRKLCARDAITHPTKKKNKKNTPNFKKL